MTSATAVQAGRFAGLRLPTWFSWRVLGASLLAGFVLGGMLVSVAWATFAAEQVGPPRDVRLVIPAGTSVLLAAGKPSAIPSEIHLVSGDRLVLINQDIVTHSIGGWSVEPAMTLTITTDAPAANIFACSIHGSGSLGIIVTARPGLVDAIIITLLVSLPLALVLAAGATVFRNLDMGPEYD